MFSSSLFKVRDKFCKRVFLTPCSKFIDVHYYKHNITLITLFINRLTFYSRKELTPHNFELKTNHWTQTRYKKQKKYISQVKNASKKMMNFNKLMKYQKSRNLLNKSFKKLPKHTLGNSVELVVIDCQINFKMLRSSLYLYSDDVYICFCETQ